MCVCVGGGGGGVPWGRKFEKFWWLETSRTKLFVDTVTFKVWLTMDNIAPYYIIHGLTNFGSIVFLELRKYCCSCPNVHAEVSNDTCTSMYHYMGQYMYMQSRLVST